MMFIKNRKWKKNIDFHFIGVLWFLLISDKERITYEEKTYFTGYGVCIVPDLRGGALRAADGICKGDYEGKPGKKTGEEAGEGRNFHKSKKILSAAVRSRPEGFLYHG